MLLLLSCPFCSFLLGRAGTGSFFSGLAAALVRGLGIWSLRGSLLATILILIIVLVLVSILGRGLAVRCLSIWLLTVSLSLVTLSGTAVRSVEAVVATFAEPSSIRVLGFSLVCPSGTVIKLALHLDLGTVVRRSYNVAGAEGHKAQG